MIQFLQPRGQEEGGGLIERIKGNYNIPELRDDFRQTLLNDRINEDDAVKEMFIVNLPRQLELLQVILHLHANQPIRKSDTQIDLLNDQSEHTSDSPPTQQPIRESEQQIDLLNDQSGHKSDSPPMHQPTNHKIRPTD